ncbi:MAG: 4-alpha-glucanotransferase [Sphaerochaetaceae bacterium]|nr:4-alpha-glucanotransferase [Sphaerochaetaceae bacterium]
MVNSNKSHVRKSGVLLHVTSFPSPFGIGDLGKEARETLITLSQAGVRLWQVLPLGPTGFGDSPYSPRSSFAGNELLIDLRTLDSLCGEKGLGKTFNDSTPFNGDRVNYPQVYSHKMVLLKEAAKLFLQNNSNYGPYLDFCNKNSWWLDDYALYQALVNKFNDSRWFLWEESLKHRKKGAITKALKENLEEVNTYKVLQYFFYSQWNSLHDFANSLGIEIIGDMPIFAASDSVDVWTHPELFKLDENLKQTAQAGVPPDAFSDDGQLWGNPVYNWPVHEKQDFSWWRQRLEVTLSQVDIVRIDHFRGFESYWEVPIQDKTAANGQWVEGPGMKLFSYFKNRNVIAEDLGVITPEVQKLIKATGFPGMKVLQFAFDIRDGKLASDNFYLPFNYSENSIAYTGTHDNNTTIGWFNELPPHLQDIIRRFLQCPDNEVSWQMIRALMSSVAKYVIVPMQDILNLGSDARMNKPSTVGSSNWSWRFNPKDLQNWMIERFKEFAMLYGRL